jgi:hypothetical protein
VTDVYEPPIAGDETATLLGCLERLWRTVICVERC